MANIYELIREDYIDEYCNDFNRWSYFSFFSIYCFAKNQKTKQENTDEAKKKLNLFLICTIPVPVVAIILFLMGLKTLL